MSNPRSLTLALAAAAVIAGLGAPAALAAPSPAAAPAVSSPAGDGVSTMAGAELDNLRWTPVRTITGGTTWMLRVDTDPVVEPGGVFFLYDPDAEESAGSFSVGDDVLVHTVRSWSGAVFAPDLGLRRTEVRYGSLADPGSARVVASVTNGWISRARVAGLQTFTGSAGDPRGALAQARALMTAAVTDGRFSECTEVSSTSGWVKVPGRTANGTATVSASCS
ncbi:hypothetical protein [Streptomyces sp. NPDC089919]|uniref:hypothetical protein n=1 Tax=Streptomyces sp. NPDC089919 TaxID=3155188 RepID=UPI00341B193A